MMESGMEEAGEEVDEWWCGGGVERGLVWKICRLLEAFSSPSETNAGS